MKAQVSYQTSLLYEDHKDVYRQIRNYLAGRFVGATRDRALLDEVVKCLFCRTFLERSEEYSTTSTDPLQLSKLYREAFGKIKKQLPAIFEENEEIQLDPVSVAFVHSELAKVELDNASRDPFGDLYEVFVGTGIREEEGQFFTPQNGVNLLVSIVSPKKGEMIIDPAAGAGGFLSSAFQHLKRLGATDKNAAQSIVGIEKDSYLTKLAATRLALISLNASNVICGDSLAWVNGEEGALNLDKNEAFDVVLTNPPFGKKIVSATKEIQKTFRLGSQWKYDQEQNCYVQNGKLLSNVPPQVLFVERCISLLKPGGRLGMVVPESLITSKSYRHVVQFMRSKGELQTVIGMPEDFFKTSGKGGTHTKACLITFKKYKNQKGTKGSHNIFMAEARWCGHDSRGRTIDKDDIPEILKNFKAFQQKRSMPESHLGYLLREKGIENHVLSPRYYSPDVKNALKEIKNSHRIVSVGELVEKGIIAIRTGDEVGKMAYGTGEIPFVRTSDISTWEIKIDPKHTVSEEIYNKFSKKQDVRENDILMVKDGTYLIGTCAIVTQYDTRIVYQSHLYKIRVKIPDIISPYLLLAIFSSEVVKHQIKAKRFTQDIIDSLGHRINELLLPIPKDEALCRRIEDTVKKAINDRIEARELARIACQEVIGNMIMA